MSRPGLIRLTLLLVVASLPFAALRAAEHEAVVARNGMVVSVSAPGSDVGRDILQKGGNAVDAAVATAFALAVTYPAAGNIGGGGFMVVHPANGGDPVVIDYRETAPAAATKTMFGPRDSTLTHKAVGVPGTVRGLETAHRKFGKLPWKDLVMPAVRLAEEGWPLEEPMASSLNAFVADKDTPELAKQTFGKDGKPDWKPGDRLVQKELAATLRQIAGKGADGFYAGKVAEQIAAEMRSGGGLITTADLAAYTAKERKPVHGVYRGYDIYSPPPPCSGGTCLVEMLNILNEFELRKEGRWSPRTLHLMAEAMRRTYADRARYLGDPDFVEVPKFLTARGHARELARSIDPHKATPSASLAGDIPLAAESDSTTHFSVIDKDGMAVSNTYTLEHSFGSRVVVRGAGFLLNNEMSDFNWLPGVTDRKGRIGTPPNQIAPGKRMLSSQTPTIVARGGKVVLVTGSPGGRTIINTVLCVVLNVLEFEMDVQAAVDAPRMHHQWFPDEIRFEGLKEHPELVKRLQEMGHTVKNGRQGDAHSIRVDPATGMYHGAADRRIMGKASGY